MFFKWIKQNLKIKAFLGTSKNAVMTQIWIALCVHLLLAYLEVHGPTGRFLQQIIRLLQLNLFARRDLMALLRGDPPPPTSTTHKPAWPSREVYGTAVGSTPIYDTYNPQTSLAFT